MTGISAACTCSVDGRSGYADTRYKGYSFTGCGAHVDYTFDLFSGAGYETAWCYVTSPRDCPGEDPYVPEGFNTDNTLPEWEAAGAAWKECYDGYRCEAWWGSLEGSAEGEPVVLDAPLDWPDCCALCSNSDSTGDGATTAAACVAWSFDPSTGSCQRMSAVESRFHDMSWGVNSTVHGYPGYFEAPITDCWGRAQYDLCVNTNAALIIPGVIAGVLGLLCVYCSAFRSSSKRTGLLRELLSEPQSSRLVKAACVQVISSRFKCKSRKGGTDFCFRYEGTFITRDGALFVVPPSRRRRNPKQPAPDRTIEHGMLGMLFTANLRPRQFPGTSTHAASTTATRSGLETPSSQEIQSEYLSLVEACSVRGSSSDQETRSATDRENRHDCLLLLGPGIHAEASRKVLLVGILGEDRITCIDESVGMSLGRRRAPLGPDSKRRNFGFCLLFVATPLLVIMCVTLLTNEAAQNMAAWTFHGNHHVGAVVGIVLCALVPVPLYAWDRRRRRDLQRLIDKFPPAAPESGRNHAERRSGSTELS